MEGESGRVRVGLEAEWVRKNTALAKSVPQKSPKAALCSPTPGADFSKMGYALSLSSGLPTAWIVYLHGTISSAS